jgi:hypothetical protein
MKTITGEYLNDLWGVGAVHALYIHDGHWYHKLRKFPGALFDSNGYVVFNTEEEYRQSPHLQIRKQISVPGRIATIPGYVRVAPVAQQMAAAVLSAEPFAPEGIEDVRRRVAQTIIQRQGQPEFRSRLLAAYDHKCCITDTDAVQALEAAHIVPYKGPKTNLCSNGLLLRADLHSLFDQGLIGIDTATMTVVVAPSICNTVYTNLASANLRYPRRAADRPSKSALDWHRREHHL